MPYRRATFGDPSRCSNASRASRTLGTMCAAIAPLTVAAHKLALERSAPPPEDDALVAEARGRAWASDDADEGRTAFLEKRPARFTGR